ncbi:MAG: twin-arginine translocase subunit TatC [Gammaproteobacteria bacterium]|nr:MAG: twin-arginine translocase subunit TatC [Gammaproteobacteria bacterium]
MSESETAEDSKSGSLMSHLFELRDRVVRMVLAVLVIFLGLFYWANDIYSYLAAPLTRHLPEGSTMIAIDVASPFLTPFKLVLMLSVFLAMPVILYQFWAFVAPGLYKNEKRIAGPLLVSSIFLFYAGMAFAYYIVFPLVFGFFTSIGPEMVIISTDIGRYLDFVLALFFGFGIAFEVPIATIILVAIGFTTPDKLAEKRPYIIVGAFIGGMFLTPPDVISQVLLAIPIWLLFEAGVIASRIIFKDQLLEAEAENDLDDSDDDDTDSDDVASEGSDYDPLSEEEMDAELDSIEKSDAADKKLDKPD